MRFYWKQALPTLRRIPPILDPLPTGPGARQQVLRTYFPDMNFDDPSVGWAEFQRIRALDTASENLVGIARILAELRPDTPALAATGVPVHVLYGDQDEIWPPSWYAEEAADLGARESIIRGARTARSCSSRASGRSLPAPTGRTWNRGRWSGPCDARCCDIVPKRAL